MVNGLDIYIYISRYEWIVLFPTDLPTLGSGRPFSMDVVVRYGIKAQLVNGKANGFILVISSVLY